MLNPLTKNLPKINLNRFNKNINVLAVNTYNYFFRYNLYEKAQEELLEYKYERENAKSSRDLRVIQDNHKWHVNRHWGTLKVNKIIS
jgi:hypothetical protein